MAKKIVFLDKQLEDLLGNKFIMKVRYKTDDNDRPILDEDGQPIIEETIYGTPRNVLVDAVSGYTKPKDNEEALKIFEIALAIKNADGTISDLRDSDIKVIERIISEGDLPVALRGQILKNHIIDAPDKDEVPEVLKSEE